MKKTKEIKKMQEIKIEKCEEKEMKNPETLAAVHTHMFFKE